MEIGNEIFVFQDERGIALRRKEMNLFFWPTIAGDVCKTEILGKKLSRFVRAAQTIKHRQAQQEKQHSLASWPLASDDMKKIPSKHTSQSGKKNNKKGNRFRDIAESHFNPVLILTN